MKGRYFREAMTALAALYVSAMLLASVASTTGAMAGIIA